MAQMASAAQKTTPAEPDAQAPVTKLFDAAQIARRVRELAPEIARAMPEDFTIVGLLKGAFVFVADLARALDGAGRRPRIAFMTLSSYGHGRESSGRVRLIGEPPDGVAGRAVLLVDDVADSGRSLVFARDLLVARGAGEISICALIDKPSRREVELAVDFIGFTVGERFVVGYGIDYAERYRHLPYIGALD
jgi:hypoxanthine phosphoribosyltransferase